MSRYLKPRDHGYLMEAAACTKVLEDLRRIEAKYARTVEKECSVRQAEFEKVMQYHSERELQDDFGWGFITEAQYDRYRLLFQQGQAAADRREWEFSALSPEDQQAERARAEQSQKEWKRKIAELKRKRGIIEAGEDMEEG